jgi:hypothetical protein
VSCISDRASTELGFECAWLLFTVKILVSQQVQFVMSGPIVRTGTNPAFWNNWDAAFGGKGAKSSSSKAAAKKGAAKKVAAKKVAAKKATAKKAVAKKKK